MARGGKREGAGRPAGTPNKATQETQAAVAASGLTPLEYMLGVINDPSADESRRDRMAQAAAPYVHPKAEAAEGGKKAQREAAARVAERGTDWESLLTAAPN